MARQAAPAAPTTRAAALGGGQHDGRTPEQLCADERPDAIVSNRLAYCVRGVAEYTRLEGNEVKGHAVVGVIISSGIKETPKAAWQETVQVDALHIENMPDGVAIGVSSTCSGICTTEGPAWGGSAVILREAGMGRHDGVLGYSSPVGKGGVAPHIQPSYHIDGKILGAGVPLPPKHDDWPGPSLRCDAQDGLRWPGCIVEGHMADVTIRKSLYGAAAVTYEWAQKNLTNPTNDYGTEERPLHRDATGDTEKKRTVTCDNAPRFVKDNFLVPEDSCDEYPFASSEEGGKPGSMCVDILPQQVGGVWDVANVKVMRGNKATAICVRSHVTETQNEKAGSEVGAATTSARILNREPYQVIIAP
ncbi:NucA/NucB deoxyribonuclease domain-containing protein [Streptomyces sp. CA-243310]|uniref:NucA/NucB deoxyribonuclease domain-containing protein n=1 Tax=Streptomyces sp. CA-243310 TaxID=3240056 RepID=UPI003D94873E